MIMGKLNRFFAGTGTGASTGFGLGVVSWRDGLCFGMCAGLCAGLRACFRA
jgi:hypothetical protein